ncbi:MAG: type VII toxin-antitoxin system HepT family RNase toxin [Spirochaetia bacterium]
MPIELDDILLQKSSIIERALRRVSEEYTLDPELESYTHTDALILNLERACQAVIDIAMHIVAKEHISVPKTSAHAFLMLRDTGIITDTSARKMTAMTGFRNIAVHQYQSINMDILRVIAETGWKDIVDFCAELGIKIQVI